MNKPWTVRRNKAIRFLCAAWSAASISGGSKPALPVSSKDRAESAVVVEPFSTQAANRRRRCRSGDNGAATPTAGLAGSCLISSGSQLSQPAMSIPEEQSLPEEHSAMQLPPPLLPPIRKAYPSASGELRITPDMLNSPSPGRKASSC